MYHILKDKRVDKTVQIICDGFLNLLKCNKFDKISISMISKETGVSRATFYRLFDKTEDIIEYMCYDVFEQIKNEMGLNKYTSSKEMIIDFIGKWIKNEELLYVLSTENMMSYLINIHINNKEFIKNLILDDKEISDFLMDYICYQFSYMLPMALDVWIKHEKIETKHQIYKSITSSTKLIAMMLDKKQLH